MRERSLVGLGFRRRISVKTANMWGIGEDGVGHV